MDPKIRIKGSNNLTDEKDWITIHLGKNPKNGGIPPSDRIPSTSESTTNLERNIEEITLEIE